MKPYTLTNAQARRFLLRHHGLIGPHRFLGKQGALDFVRQSGCIQYDPIDVCGKNSELVLQSRVSGFEKSMLDELLYADRALVDYFDKQLAIIPVEDWPYFAREREKYRTQGRSQEAIDRAEHTVKALLAERPFVSSVDLDMNEKVDWYWSDTRLSRAVLETLYFRGELCVHHKRGTNKHYALAKNVLPATLLSANDPNETEEAFRDWHTLRRVQSVGLLSDRASDAFLGLDRHKNGGRAQAFENLLRSGDLLPVRVEGDDVPMYTAASCLPLLTEALSGADYAPRMELIAPLDNLIWDRKLIARLFDFSYTWEIYTPQAKRRYGYYVLPLLSGDRFAGRVEAVCDRKASVMRVKNVWWEKRPQTVALRKCLRRFARFNGCLSIEGMP